MGRKLREYKASIARVGKLSLMSVPDQVKFSDDQPRDEQGRWTSTGVIDEGIARDTGAHGGDRSGRRSELAPAALLDYLKTFEGEERTDAIVNEIANSQERYVRQHYGRSYARGIDPEESYDEEGEPGAHSLSSHVVSDDGDDFYLTSTFHPDGTITHQDD